MLERTPGTVKEIDLELDWHRQAGDTTIPKKCDCKGKALMLAALITAVERRNANQLTLQVQPASTYTELDDDTEDEADLVGY